MCGIFVSMDLYHVLNRGVDKRDIFVDDRDRARFVHDMYEFNDTSPSGNAYRDFMMDVGRPSLKKRDRNCLVDIHGWVLMGNHYHLLLSDRIENGISLFLKKLNGGYAKYFNERHQRDGSLFQGRTKKILIDSDAYFTHILNYIHFNPLDQLSNSSNWRQRQIKDANRALEHLGQYRWSSYLDYTGVKNFPSILTTDLFNNVFDDYKDSVTSYITDIHEQDLKDLTLEQ